MPPCAGCNEVLRVSCRDSSAVVDNSFMTNNLIAYLTYSTITSSFSVWRLWFEDFGIRLASCCGLWLLLPPLLLHAVFVMPLPRLISACHPRVVPHILERWVAPYLKCWSDARHLWNPVRARARRVLYCHSTLELFERPSVIVKKSVQAGSQVSRLLYRTIALRLLEVRGRRRVLGVCLQENWRISFRHVILKSASCQHYVKVGSLQSRNASLEFQNYDWVVQY